MNIPDSLLEDIAEIANTRAITATNAGQDIVQDDARNGFLSPADALRLLREAGIGDLSDEAIYEVQTLFAAAWDAAVEAELEAPYL